MKDEMFEFQKNSMLGKINGQPLCADFKSAWRQCGNDKEMLVRLALMQQSQPFFSYACYKHLGLSKEYIKNEFADYINGYTIHDADNVKGYTYGLYVDWDYENDLVVDKDVVSAMWCVGTNMVVPETKCPVIYLSNKSNVHLIGEGFNSINVKLFDKSVLTIEDLDEESEVVVYKYSTDAKVKIGKYCLGKVKVFDKQLKL